jgi:hypothetical protein
MYPLTAPAHTNRTVVRLIGTSAIQYATVAARPFKQLDNPSRRQLRTIAVAEAIRVFRSVGWNYDIWSHAFECHGGQFLLSARIRSAHPAAIACSSVGAGKDREARSVAHESMVIEVSPAPRGLTPRTLFETQPTETPRHRPSNRLSVSTKKAYHERRTIEHLVRLR